MSQPGERLSVIADVLDATLEGEGDPVIIDATHDSRQVGAGTVFIAVRGMAADGHDYIDQAISRGASAVIVEEDGSYGVPSVVVHDTRAAMARVAVLVHHNPSAELAVVGLTGTNGKTSVAYILESILVAAGRRTGVIGTVATRIGDRSDSHSPHDAGIDRLAASAA